MGDSSIASDSGDGQTDVPRIATDGDSREHSDTRQSHLQTLFVNVTGVRECIDEQESTGTSRYVDADNRSVSAAATAVAADDGLADTIDASQSNDEMG
ncbi:MAG: hypothetical protein ACI9K3_001391 [Halovenus sp.]|jgi:hypothetical protein